MSKKARMEGGFAYRNAGTIENSYASVKIGRGKSENAGLIYDNSGEVLHCFTRSAVHKWEKKEKQGKEEKKQKDGLFVINNGSVSESFFLVKKEKELKKYRDKELGLTIEQAQPDFLKENYNWDYSAFEEENASDMEFLEEAWEYTARYVEEEEEKGERSEERSAQPRRRRENVMVGRRSRAGRIRKTLLQMQKASAMRKKAAQAGKGSAQAYRTNVRNEKGVQEKRTETQKEERVKTKERPKPVLIGSEEEFLDFVDRVNKGEPEAAFGSFELTCDLDFHGKTIPSVGCDRQHPFSGLFDGKRHVIRGFALNGKDMAEIGFFGHLEGIVQNLSIDCLVKGKKCPMTAAFCAYNGGEIHCCEAVTEVCAGRYAGMFVGENKGVIERCCVSGRSRGAFLFWLWPLLPIAFLAVGILANPPKKPQEYVPIMADAQIVPNEEKEVKKRENENKASYEVPKELIVDKASMTVRSEPYAIKNPDRGGNYDFVAVLYMKNSAGNDVEIYRSGRIPLGYHIEQMKLTPPEGTTLSEGIYDAEIVFSFYHQNSGEKGMVDSRVPIRIEIR